MQVGELSQPKIEGLYMALELMELGYQLVHQRFIRENPGADEDAIRNHMRDWINSPREAKRSSLDQTKKVRMWVSRATKAK